MNFFKKLLITVLGCLLCFSLVACDFGNNENEVKDVTSDVESAEALSLNGHSLHIYCGAGMTKPFQEIADAFTLDSGCKMDITFGNGGQSQSQINTSGEGDLFVAGARTEIEPISDMVSTSVDLVKHIPILAVREANPKNINGLEDLTNSDIRVVLGDSPATPLGKIADKAFADAGITDKVNIVARSATAPAVINALALDECDVVLVWKENIIEGTEAVETTDLDPYIKTIPAASLTCCADSLALNEFLDFLKTDAVTTIWEAYGYEVIAQ